MKHPSIPAAPSYELRFEPLHFRGAALAFPCDASGKVAMDDLTDRARMNYLFARAVVGRGFFYPIVKESALCQ